MYFDPAALASAISDLLDDPASRARLGCNARAFAQGTYDLKRVCVRLKSGRDSAVMQVIGETAAAFPALV